MSRSYLLDDCKLVKEEKDSESDKLIFNCHRMFLEDNNERMFRIVASLILLVMFITICKKFYVYIYSDNESANVNDTHYNEMPQETNCNIEEKSTCSFLNV